MLFFDMSLRIVLSNTKTAFRAGRTPITVAMRAEELRYANHRNAVSGLVTESVTLFGTAERAALEYSALVWSSVDLLMASGIAYAVFSPI
jgi:hypothetical protein